MHSMKNTGVPVAQMPLLLLLLLSSKEPTTSPSPGKAGLPLHVITQPIKQVHSPSLGPVLSLSVFP